MLFTSYIDSVITLLVVMDLEAELARFEAELAGLAQAPEQSQEQARPVTVPSHAPPPHVPPPQAQARMQGQVNYSRL